MPAPASMMPSIEERKRLIVLQSDLHRALLEGEIVAIRERLAGFDSMREKVRHASPWLGLAAAVGGLLTPSASAFTCTSCSARTSRNQQ